MNAISLRINAFILSTATIISAKKIPAPLQKPGLIRVV